MKRLFFYLFIIAFFLCFTVSCYYDNEEALFPTLNSSCDTTNVTYSGTIVPILNNNCLSCHTVAATGGSVLLTSYGQVVANASRITGSIKQLSSFSPMPKGGDKLKSCLINQWDIWVRNGMPNN